jgi:4-diphosphocytidyl-2-C-methyl-D-erythritol kinase
VITELARAKINLTLRIMGRRPDGYHEIVSLIAFADDAADVVTLDPDAPATVTVGGPFAGAIVGANLVETALQRVAAAAPRLKLGSVHVEKNLPVAAGIGGGSADAAAALRAVKRANQELDGYIDWMEFAAELGADVPVCVLDRPCVVRGFGERLVPLSGLPSLTAVLVNPMAEVPPDKTAQVFRLLAAPPLQPSDAARASNESEPSFRDSDDLIAHLRTRGNDLQTAACRIVPGISEVLASLDGTPGCLYASLSGAGPTCFGIFKEAEAAADALRKANPGWWVCATTIGGS